MSGGMEWGRISGNPAVINAIAGSQEDDTVNRIDGKRIDFSLARSNKSVSAISFEDITSNPDEIHIYYQEEDYSNLFIRFIRIFEEVVGLKRYRFRIAA